MSREEMRFLADVAARPLSTTVSRYQRLHLSRRRGNAIRQALARTGLIEAVAIATRSGQVFLYQLTDAGRAVCEQNGIDPGPQPRAGLEHSFWVRKVASLFESKDYTVTIECPVKGNGTVDLVGERPGERVAVEVETGRSDIKENLTKVRSEGFDRIVLVATSPAAAGACQRALAEVKEPYAPVEMMSWLDVS